MTWKSEIPGCFGTTDKKFALHPAEVQRAFDLLKELRDQQVPWQDVEAEFEDYLMNAAPQNQQHRDEQMKRVRRYMEPWING